MGLNAKFVKYRAHRKMKFFIKTLHNAAITAIFASLMQCSFAHEINCEKLSDEAEDKGSVIIPRITFEVATKGRLQFYSAPSDECIMPGIFIIKGDSIISQVEYNGWLQIAYIKKDNEMISAWIKNLTKLRKTGRIGNQNEF